MGIVDLNCGSIRADEDFLTPLVALKLDTLRGVFAYSGKGYLRTHANRDNFHVVEEIDGKVYDLYLKRHRGFETKEALKLLAAQSPFATAGRREWDNIAQMKALGIATMRPVAFGEEKFGCVELGSFLVTERIPDARPMDDFLREHYSGVLSAEALREKRALLWDLGDLVRRLHSGGLTHMDLYLNHVFVRETARREKVLYLIDLQRVARRWLLKRRWVVKDLAAVVYSGRNLPLTRSDYARFFSAYFDGRGNGQDKGLIHAAIARAARMAARVA
jgi:heptose I phosphotransferase